MSVDTIWGCAAGWRDNSPGVTTTGVNEFNRINNAIKAENGGYGMQARRTYSFGIPSSINSSEASAHVGDLVIAHSVCPVDAVATTGWQRTIAGNHDSVIRSLALSCPDQPSDPLTYLIYKHEPEDDAPTGGRTWSQAWARFAKVVLDAGNPRVVPTFCLMAWTWETSSRNPEDWNPRNYMTAGEAAASCGTVDGYAIGDPNHRTPNYMFSEPYSDIVGQWGFRFGIMETGCEAHLSGHDQFQLNLETFAGSHNVDVICWWHSQVDKINPATGQRVLGTWLDGTQETDHTGSITTWSDIIARNQGADIPIDDPGDVVIPPGGGDDGGIHVSPDPNPGGSNLPPGDGNFQGDIDQSASAAGVLHFVGRKPTP